LIHWSGEALVLDYMVQIGSWCTNALPSAFVLDFSQLLLGFDRILITRPILKIRQKTERIRIFIPTFVYSRSWVSVLKIGVRSQKSPSQEGVIFILSLCAIAHGVCL